MRHMGLIVGGLRRVRCGCFNALARTVPYGRSCNGVFCGLQNGDGFYSCETPLVFEMLMKIGAECA